MSMLTLAPPYLGQPGPGGDRVYLPNKHLLNAARLAFALSRPLLLTGEPGCGKTELAWVLADQRARMIEQKTGQRLPPGAAARRPLICRVNSQTRAQDLLYHYDALQRLADAQHGADPALARDPRNYVELRELGLGLLYGERRVVLIDEIDKAPRDLPNDLLHVVEEGWFRIHELRRIPSEPPVTDPHGVELHHEMYPDGRAGRPLIVITSNAERQLPEPFLRRCVFFHVPMPTKPELEEILRRRLGEGHPALREAQLRVYMALRADSLGLTKRPSTAELLDWVQALYALPDPIEATRRIHEFSAAIDPETYQLHEASQGRVHWADLPGLPCLVKLREDLERLGATTGRA
jgi:MoxR-like ATPase